MQKSNVKSLNKIEELKKRLVEIAHLSSAVAVLGWDQEVYMPKKGATQRAKTLAHLSGIIHQKFVGIDYDKLLTNLKKDLDKNKLKKRDQVIVFETWRSFIRAKKIPEHFVRELTELSSNAQVVWTEARRKSDFKLFKPWLKKIVKLKQKEAEYIGYKESAYDTLIDGFEPGMTAAEASKILNDLKDFLVPFIKKIKKSKVKNDSKALLGKFPISLQYEFNKEVSRKIGFDLDAGRIDISTHPFTTNFNQFDVRFTTRYRENDALYALGSTIHEAGHALYEQGLPEEHFGTPLAESISLGIHESQSRMWENVIGKSLEFWKYFYPKLQKKFPVPYKNISLQDFYTIINRVKPSLIRTESDEVTYNLHIIIRFEIEKELIEGSIAVKDVPKIWNDKVKHYLGITVPDDARGCLQDVHWSFGGIGYFPTYSFGNLYSAQFYAVMKRQIPNLEKKIAMGDFKTILTWLRKNIHQYGKLYTADGLAKKITGESLNSKYFTGYLTEKYSKLYKLKKEPVESGS